MRINNNMMFMNPNRQLDVASKIGSESIAKSSVKVINNKRLDDIVELSISGRMRSQSRRDKSSLKINSGSKITVPLRKKSTAGLIITDLRISEQSGLEGETREVDKSIARVSNEKAAMGASENRLGHNSPNIDNPPKGLEGGESKVKDEDMAKGIIEKVKENMLRESSNTILAQGNSNPGLVLQLLR